MSLQYLLDGYNLMHQMPSLISLDNKLEDKRRALIEHIEKNQLQGSSNNKITVVFDGKCGIWGSQSTTKTKVIFSSDETADEKIKKIVECSDSKKSIVVVTDDRSIQYAVRASGCRVVGTREFLAKGILDLRKRARKQGQKMKGRVPTKDISKTLENKITSELKQIWLDKE